MFKSLGEHNKETFDVSSLGLEAEVDFSKGNSQVTSESNISNKLDNQEEVSKHFQTNRPS